MSENNATALPFAPGFSCDLSYSGIFENLKYLLQCAYMVPPAILYARILYVIWVKNRKIYIQHQFFVIYSMDSLMGLFLLLLDIFIIRFFIYTPQFCESGSKFFLSHPILMDIYYPFFNYLHCCQPLIQIFLTLNRMSSVVWPVDHNKIWRKNLSFIIIFILITPFLFIWNTVISPKILISYFGGFSINYQKLVPWAGMTLFLMILRSIAAGITVVSTVITFWKMSKMRNRLKKSEKTLCFACAGTSICFLIPAIFAAFKTWNSFWAKHWMSDVLQPFAWDVLNVGSPFIMIFVSGQLRSHVFDFSIFRNPSVVTVHTATVIMNTSSH
ncbi:Protein CBG17483 [Caenorhabditis briggsae]|uniref:Serpentine receptor class gamma n=1 Tax=Caenorhabditis briggsae TaxID=6238 RepID=A8XR34_CAEBR|nr:Protein CBG17483 [Caenorhabditis briggsae]CAP35107.1 Protein CBG17483 [Caenorhabditis briggsae]